MLFSQHPHLWPITNSNDHLPWNISPSCFAKKLHIPNFPPSPRCQSSFCQDFWRVLSLQAPKPYRKPAALAWRQDRTNHIIEIIWGGFFKIEDPENDGFQLVSMLKLSNFDDLKVLPTLGNLHILTIKPIQIIHIYPKFRKLNFSHAQMRSERQTWC